MPLPYLSNLPKKTKTRAIICLSVFLIWWALFALGLPAGLRYLIDSKVSTMLDKPLKVEKISFSPFTFTLKMQNILSGEEEEENLKLEKLTLDLGIWASIFSASLVVSSIELDKPFIHIELNEEGELDIGGIKLKKDDNHQKEKSKETEQEEQVEKEKKIFPFTVQRFQLDQGKISFYEADKDFYEAMENIRIQALKLSSKKDRQGRLQGGWKFYNGGNCSFSILTGLNPVFARGHLGLGDLDLTAYSGFIPDLFTGTLEKARFSMGLDLLFEDEIFSLPHLKAHILDLSILQADKSEFFSLKALRLAAGPLEPLKNSYVIENILLNSPRVQLTKNQDEIYLPFNLPKAEKKEFQEVSYIEDQKESEEKSTLYWALNLLSLENGKIIFKDNSLREEEKDYFSETIENINIRGSSFTSDDRENAKVLSSLDFKSGGNFKLELLLKLQDLDIQGSFNLKDFFIPKYSPYFPEEFTGVLEDGSLSLLSNFHFNESNFSIEDFRGKLMDLKVLNEDREKFFTMSRFELSDTDLFPKKGEYRLGSIEIEKPEVYLREDKDKLILPFTLKEKEEGRIEEEKIQVEKDKAETEDEKKDEISLKLENFALKEGAFSFSKLLSDETAISTLSKIELGFKDFSFPQKEETAFNFSTMLNKRGDIKINGGLLLDPLNVRADFKLKDIEPGAFSAYTKHYAQLSIPRGKSELNGNMSWNKEKGLKLESDFKLDNFALRRSLEKDNFFKLGSFALKGLSIEEKPELKISLNDGLLKDASFRLDRDKEGIRPFAQSGQADEEIKKEDQELKKTDDKKDGEDKKETVLILKNFIVQNNSFTFYDQSISPNFYTEIKEIKAQLKDIDTSREDQKFSLVLSAIKDAQSPVNLNIEGKMADIKKSTNLDFKLDDFEMASLSPYTRHYLGRPFERGKMKLKLDWDIKSSKLNTENQMHIESLKIGERIKDSKAPSIPLGLAQALLEDKDGIILIDLPVTGELDDPKFRIGPTIWRAFTGLITRVASSPFTALASIGGKSISSEILFEPGLAEIDEKSLENLRLIAENLKKRPLLRLEMSALTGPEDDKALALAKVEEKISKKIRREEEREKAIRTLYREAMGVKPEDPEDIEAMLNDLRKLESIDEAMQAHLRTRRLEAARSVLIKEEGIEASRLFTKEKLAKDGPKLEFSLDTK